MLASGLNPYYTGIHLHTDDLLDANKINCLNPYYTGIHLHTKKELQRLTEKRLNPYYTGIHLHFRLSSLQGAPTES